MTAPQSVQSDFGWALGTVMRSYMREADQVMVGVPGGPRGYQVLAACGREGPRTQLALAQQLGLDRTVMTYLLDDLQKDGLVERRPDPADRRARRVELTDGGHQRLCELAGRLREAEDRLLERLDPEEREALRRMLFRLATGSDATTGDLCTMADEIQSRSC